MHAYAAKVDLSGIAPDRNCGVDLFACLFAFRSRLILLGSSNSTVDVQRGCTSITLPSRPEGCMRGKWLQCMTMITNILRGVRRQQDPLTATLCEQVPSGLVQSLWHIYFTQQLRMRALSKQNSARLCSCSLISGHHNRWDLCMQPSAAKNLQAENRGCKKGKRAPAAAAGRSARLCA